MRIKFRDELDPLDEELLERALEGAMAAAKENHAFVELDSDEALEAALRHELIEIARFNGVSDAEALRDIALGRLSRAKP